MTYRVMLTNHARDGLKATISYISRVLLTPQAAGSWSLRIKKAIKSLDELPHRYPLVEEEPWRTEGIRKMPIDNFIVYFRINEDTATVWITAVVYGKRDQISALRDSSEC